MRVGGRRVRVFVEVQSPDVNEDRARPVVLAFGALASTAFAVDRFYGQGWGWVVAAVGLCVAAIAALVRDAVDPPDDEE
jgi:hypothetical protein